MCVCISLLIMTVFLSKSYAVFAQCTSTEYDNFRIRPYLWMVCYVIIFAISRLHYHLILKFHCIEFNRFYPFPFPTFLYASFSILLIHTLFQYGHSRAIYLWNECYSLQILINVSSATLLVETQLKVSSPFPHSLSVTCTHEQT